MSLSAESGQPKPTEDAAVEDALFHPPRDLICPITQNLFADPVVNSVGQIYERQAFLAYLHSSQEKTDPVTRQPLDVNVVTSIYAVKARAMEYREETARKCVELATQNDASTALKYLKRAAELCSETDILVPGLSRETMGRILRQSSNAGYTSVILMSFAEDLMKEGLCDRAACVYSTLLMPRDGHYTQQPDLMKCCIDCWIGNSVDGRPNEDSLPKFLDFVEQQQAFSWGQIIDFMHQSHVDEHLILRFCEALLVKDDPNPALWRMQKDVMLKYIQIRCCHLKEKQEVVEKDVKTLMEWKERVSRTGGLKTRRMIPLSVLKERRKPFFLKKRFIASLILGALELMNGGCFAKRVSKTAAILYIVNSC